MFGSHLSISGSMTNALLEAEALGLDSVQVFTKNQQQWNAKPLERAAVDDWTSHTRRLKWDDGRIVSHASYLANLASPNPELYKASIELMRIELERAEQLGIRLVVFHPGAFTTSSLEEGTARIAAACAQLIKETAGFKAVLCLENVAGQGSTIGRTFEELADLHGRITQAVGSSDRIGFCIDTAHAHEAGYDLSKRADAERVLAEMTAKLGKGNIRCMHINDSKTPAGSRVDRHAHIGEGTIGLAGFAAVVNYPPFANIPKMMETPKEEKKPAPTTSPMPTWDQTNVGRLRGLIGHRGDTYPAFTPIGVAAPVKAAGKPAAKKGAAKGAPGGAAGAKPASKTAKGKGAKSTSGRANKK